MKKIFVLILLISLFASGSTYIKGPALIEGVTSTVTAAGTTTLTAASETNQVFTGATTQTITLPNATTLPVGRKFSFINRSTGALLVRNAGATIIKGVGVDRAISVYLTDNSTSNGVWQATGYVVDFAETSQFTGILPNANTTATEANTASAIVARNGSGNFTAGTITADLTGNASTSSALAANPADCGANTFAQSIAANGALTCAAVNISTADATGVAPIARGGTNNGSLAVTNGGALYTDGSQIVQLGPGTSGQIYSSGGAGAPTWLNQSNNNYTPTLTNGTNMAASTARNNSFIRVGAFVMQCGYADYDITTANTPSLLGISFSVASNLSAAGNLAGTCSSTVITTRCLVEGDAANDRATLTVTNETATGNESVYYCFMYVVQ